MANLFLLQLIVEIMLCSEVNVNSDLNSCPNYVNSVKP